MELVKEFKQEGYSIKDSCKMANLSRSYYYKKTNIICLNEKEKPKDEEIINKIKELKALHPFWGYRRIRAWLVYREKIEISKNKVLKLMRKNNLLVDLKTYKAKRKAKGSKPKADKPLQYWGIDMTKFKVESLGWVYLVVVIDWFTKKVVGYNIGLRSKSEDWKNALNMAVLNEFPDGVKGAGLKLISDNGCQPTSISFMQEMAVLGIEQIFTSYNNPKGNADTERFMRTIKEEVIWINEFSNLEEVKKTLNKWINYDYNKFYVHSKLGYKSPEEFTEEYYSKLLAKAA